MTSLKVPEKAVEKSKTMEEESHSKHKLEAKNLLKTPNQPPARSKSEKAPETLKSLNSQRSTAKNSPNLLQIPQSFVRQSSFESEEEKGDTEVVFDGMNKVTHFIYPACTKLMIG